MRRFQCTRCSIGTMRSRSASGMTAAGIASPFSMRTAADFVAGNGFVLGKFFGGRFLRGARLCGGLLRAGRLAKEEAAVGKFLDEAAFF